MKDRTNQRDEWAARATNAAFAVENTEPVGTCTPATTVERHISIDPPCSCDCRSFCLVCKPGAA